MKKERFEYIVAVRRNEHSEVTEFGFHTRKDRDDFVKDAEKKGWVTIKTIDREEEREL